MRVDRCADITAGLLWPKGSGWQLEAQGQSCVQRNGHPRGVTPGQNPAYRLSAHLFWGFLRESFEFCLIMVDSGVSIAKRQASG